MSMDCLSMPFPFIAKFSFDSYRFKNDIEHELFIHAFSYGDHLQPRPCRFQNMLGV